MERLSRYIKGDRQKIAFAFLLSMPGAPFIYYGDEIGMRYVEGLTSVEGGYDRTGSRSPMQWDNTVNAGFSRAPKKALYICQDESEDRPTAAAQMADEKSLWSEVKRLIQIRSQHKALQSRGRIEFVYAEKETYPLAYIRQAEGERILVVLNPSEKQVTFPCEVILAEMIYSLGGEIAVDCKTATVPACSAGFYRI